MVFSFYFCINIDSVWKYILARTVPRSCVWNRCNEQILITFYSLVAGSSHIILSTMKSFWAPRENSGDGRGSVCVLPELLFSSSRTVRNSQTANLFGPHMLTTMSCDSANYTRGPKIIVIAHSKIFFRISKNFRKKVSPSSISNSNNIFTLHSLQ